MKAVVTTRKEQSKEEGMGVERKERKGRFIYLDLVFGCSSLKEKGDFFEWGERSEWQFWSIEVELLRIRVVMNDIFFCFSLTIIHSLTRW